MKQCTRCKKTKEKTQFNIQKSTKDGLNCYCRTCSKEKYDARMEANRKLVVDWTGSKICRVCNIDKPMSDFSGSSIVKSGIDSRCKICTNEDSRERWRDNKEYNNRKQRALHHKDPARNMLYQCKARAKRQDVPFNITKEDIKVPDKCPVLGIPLIVANKLISDNSPTVDKFIPELGYVKGNVAVISKLANMIKTSATSEQVLQVANWMKQQEKHMFNWTMEVVTAPISDSLYGLTEGELRTRAIARLGADAVVGMGVSELIEVLTKEDDL